MDKNAGTFLCWQKDRNRHQHGLQFSPLRKASLLALVIWMVLQPASRAGVRDGNCEFRETAERALQYEGNRSQSGSTGASQETAFQLRDGFLIVVDGRIATLPHLKFILDTGSTGSMIDTKIADQLGLPRQSGAVLNFEHYAKIDWTNVAEIQFGPIAARNVRIMVGALDQFSQFTTGIDAIIGLDLLRQTQKLGIDFQARLLTFGELKESQYAITTPPQVLTVLLEVQGSLLRLIIDTGLREILVFADRLHAHAPHLKLLNEGRAHEGRMPGRIATIPGIRLIPNSQASVFLLDRAPQSLPENIDGFLSLKALNVDFAEIDFGSKTLTMRSLKIGSIMLASDSKASKHMPEQENSEEHNYPFR